MPMDKPCGVVFIPRLMRNTSTAVSEITHGDPLNSSPIARIAARKELASHCCGVVSNGSLYAYNFPHIF